MTGRNAQRTNEGGRHGGGRAACLYAPRALWYRRPRAIPIGAKESPVTGLAGVVFGTPASVCESTG